MVDQEMKRLVNAGFIEKAQRCRPRLKSSVKAPLRIVAISSKGDTAEIQEKSDGRMLPRYSLGKGESLCLDFGTHYVGYVTLKFNSVGSPQDAPAFLRLKFAEVPGEILDDSGDYHGWISRGWIQEEFIHLDVLPAEVRLPRRYAFRYLEILALDTSKKWKLVVEEAKLSAVSAADPEAVFPFHTQDKLLKDIDRVSVRTLANCMQDVFEDGPKRDRRLWIGDLRLQALANYETFRDYKLVKRCLYLFAGLTRDDGRVGACVFTEPDYIVDDTFFFDYSLFFVPVLYDYYMESGDEDTLKELWPCAKRQIELASQEFGTTHVVREMEANDCFLDWKAGLDKQAGAQAVYIYCVRRGACLARILGCTDEASRLEREAEEKAAAAMKYLWDGTKGMFISGRDRQISYASQVWMVLAEVVKGKEARELLNRLDEEKPEMGMVTPYMNHHYVEALLLCGEEKKALDYIKYYWGGMVEGGADTFWELYNPENREESPYGSRIVNSYCHAWSCTPAFLLRKIEKIF
ncbi:MAG: cellobiose phosphorylase [Eubacteriales bacterium]|nr:cellobiose phosphorylase [Eubacteriales bacterium]